MDDVDGDDLSDDDGENDEIDREQGEMEGFGYIDENGNVIYVLR